MTKKELIKLIREVVQLEIKNAVRSELNEAFNELEAKTTKQKVSKNYKNYTKNTMLNEILNTTDAGEFESYPEISANSLRSKFSSMQDMNPTVHMTDINNRPVDIQSLPEDLAKALTRDYSKLVKRF